MKVTWEKRMTSILKTSKIKTKFVWRVYILLFDLYHYYSISKREVSVVLKDYFGSNTWIEEVGETETLYWTLLMCQQIAIGILIYCQAQLSPSPS